MKGAAGADGWVRHDCGGFWGVVCLGELELGAWSLELGVGHDVAVVVVVSIDKDLGAGPRYVHNLYAETWASPILQLPASKFRIVHRNEAQTSSTPKIDSKSSATSITLQMNEIEDGGNRRVFKMATLLM